MHNDAMTKKQLRLGRIYHIEPNSIPPNETIKEREAVYVGFVENKNMRSHIFVQMGDTQYYGDGEWKKINRVGYFPIFLNVYFPITSLHQIS